MRLGRYLQPVSTLIVLSLVGTTTILNTSGSPVAAGAAMTFTANIAGAGPTGGVIFKSDGSSIAGCGAVPRVAGSAQRVTSFATFGAKTIAAVYKGDRNTAATTSTLFGGQVISVLSQAIVFGTAPTVNGGGSGTVSATGGGSTNTVTFGNATLAVCTVEGNVVSAVWAGSCAITADQADNATYSAVPQVTQIFVVAIAAFNVTPSAGANCTINPVSP